MSRPLQITVVALLALAVAVECMATGFVFAGIVGPAGLQDKWAFAAQLVGNGFTVFAVWFAATLAHRSAEKMQRAANDESMAQHRREAEEARQRQEADHKVALEQQRREFRNQRQLEVFKILLDRLTSSSARLSEANSTIMVLSGAFEMWSKFPVCAPRRTIEEITQIHYQSSRGVLELIAAFETHQIMFPGIETQIPIVTNALREHDENWEKFRSLVMTPLIILKVARNNGAEATVPQPNEDLVARVREAEASYRGSNADLTSYVIDLMGIGQNVLLGPIFGGRVAERRPTDPKYKVLKLPEDGSAH